MDPNPRLSKMYVQNTPQYGSTGHTDANQQWQQQGGATPPPARRNVGGHQSTILKWTHSWVIFRIFDTFPTGIAHIGSVLNFESVSTGPPPAQRQFRGQSPLEDFHVGYAEFDETPDPSQFTYEDMETGIFYLSTVSIQIPVSKQN